jgi:hypothetical protein
MLGFDPAGRMLHIGKSNDEDVFLAMAPNEFLRGRSPPVAPGRSSASSLMSKQHYRQILMLFAHFLALLPLRAFYNEGQVYKQDLDSPVPEFGKITSILCVFLLLLRLPFLPFAPYPRLESVSLLSISSSFLP